MLCNFLGRQPAVVELRVREQSHASTGHLDELAELEIAEADVVLAPERRNRGGPDLRFAVGRDREVHAEERVAQIRHRIDVRPERAGRLVGI